MDQARAEAAKKQPKQVFLKPETKKSLAEAHKALAAAIAQLKTLDYLRSQKKQVMWVHTRKAQRNVVLFLFV